MIEKFDINLINQYVSKINKVLETKDFEFELLAYNFFRMLEVKARVERFGKRINISDCLKKLDNHLEKLLSFYEDSFYENDFANDVINCARNIEKNLLLFAEDSEKNEENEEIKSDIEEENEEIKSDIEEESFDILIQRENMELIYQELLKIFNDGEKLNKIKAHISYVDSKFLDFYFTPELATKIKEYVKVNNVDIDKMWWFDRLPIDRMPILLNEDIEDLEVENLMQEIEAMDENSLEFLSFKQKIKEGK